MDKKDAALKNCPKCASVVKEWDVVCPVCGSTLIALSEPKNSIKVKGDLPGWGDFKGAGAKEADRGAQPPQAADTDFDKRLVRAAIKSDYEKGKEPPEKALKALGQVSFLEGQAQEQGKAGGGDEVEELDGVEELDEGDAAEAAGPKTMDKPDAADEIGPEDILESDEAPPGVIVVEGKKRAPKPEGQEAAQSIKQLLDAPVPSTSMGEFKAAPIPRVAPPPQAAPAQVASTPQYAAPVPQASAVPAPAAPSPQQPYVSQPFAAQDLAGSQAAAPAPAVRSTGQQGRGRQPRTTQPISLGSQGQPAQATPAASQPGQQPRTKSVAEGKQTMPGLGETAGKPPGQRFNTNPPGTQQYDPETLRRIMQQAQAAAMMRKPGKEGTRISLPLAILLIAMGTLSILGLAIIMFLLISM